MTSTFLKPQTMIEDVKSTLTMHPMYVVQHRAFCREAQKEIPHEVFDHLIQELEKSGLLIDQEVLGPDAIEDIKETYTWKQKEDTIIISWLKSAEVKKDVEIQITNNNIESGLVCGDLYGTVIDDPVVDDDGTRVQVTLTVAESKWPILIKGGKNIDRASLFYFAACASKVENMDFFETLLIHAADMGSVLATSTLGYFCTQMKKNAESFYHFVKFSFQIDQDDILLIIARILMYSRDGHDLALAENVLIVAANGGSKDAFFMLGQLHLTKARGFKSDPELATQYFEYGIEHFQDKNCMRALGKLYAIGVGVESNPKKAVSLLKASGMTTEEIKETGDQALVQVALHDEPESDIVDATIATAILGVVAVGCYYGIKWIKKLRRK